MKKVTQLVTELAEPIVTENGCTLWDVEYVKEAGTWFLRLYIDHPDGVSIDHCEAVSQAMSVLLDQVDPIEGSYVFEVSSAGADRVLKRPSDFAQFMGRQIVVKLYQSREGKKEFVGALTDYQAGDVTLSVGEASVSFAKKEIAQVRLYVSF